MTKIYNIREQRGTLLRRSSPTGMRLLPLILALCNAAKPTGLHTTPAA
ncbi:MAG: hypothetical protein K2J11_08000 [Oscillospiraceae bacterium]|nr:hypothetical protein [Oscillospiraceae bacterium]